MTKVKSPRRGNFYDRFFNVNDPNNILVDQLSSSEFIVGRANAGTRQTDFSWQLSTVTIYGNVQQVVFAADGEPRFRWIDRKLVLDPDINPDGSPSGIYITSNSIDANSPAGTIVGDLFPKALDVGKLSYAFEITSDPSNKFELDPNQNNRLLLKDIALGVDGEYTLDIRVVDSELREFTDTLTINVASIRLSNDVIDEDAGIGAKIADIIAVEGQAPVTFSIIADPDNKFDVVGADLVLDEDIDFETKAEHLVTIQSTDALSNTRQETFTISVRPASASSGIESVTTQDKDNRDALRTYPVNNIGPFGQYDRLDASYPSTASELYTYSLNGTVLGTVTVTYTDSKKNTLVSTVYDEL